MKTLRTQHLTGQALVIGLGAAFGFALSALVHRTEGGPGARADAPPKPPAKPMAPAPSSLVEMPPGFAGLPLRQWRDHGSLDQQLRAALATAHTCPWDRIPLMLREINSLRGQEGIALQCLEMALAARWVDADPAAALTAALPLVHGPGNPQQPEPHLVLKLLATTHPALLLDRWSEVQPSLRQRPHLAPDLIDSILQAAPERAAELHASLQEDPKLAAAALTALWHVDREAAKRTVLADGTIDDLVRWWVKEDPAAANRWALENAPKQLNPYRIGVWAQADPAGCLAFFESEATPEAKAAMLRPLSLEIGKDDPRDGIDWLATQPASSDRTKAIAQNLVDWLGRDSEAASLWLREQSPGDERDSLVRAFSTVAVGLDPPTAIQWAATIDDATMRDSALHRNFEYWWRQDPRAAGAWLDDPPALPAELLDKWRQKRGPVE
jgi:hypothetical protein